MGFVQGQAHDARVTALDGFDKAGGHSLYAIGTGLAHRFATFHISLQILGAQGGKSDLRDLHPQLDRKSTRLNSSHSQQSRMPSSA